jgi:hypothetical protein
MVMDDAATDGATFAEAVVFLSYFKDRKDPRQQGKVAYPLDEILLLCLFAVLAGAECFTEIALFGVKRRDFLRRFRPFKDGTPDHGHLGDIPAVLDPEGQVAAVKQAPAGTPKRARAVSSDNARKRRTEAPSPATQTGMQLHTADGIRKYLTAGERDAFLREADMADRPVRTLCMG